MGPGQSLKLKTLGAAPRQWRWTHWGTHPVLRGQPAVRWMCPVSLQNRLEPREERPWRARTAEIGLEAGLGAELSGWLRQERAQRWQRRCLESRPMVVELRWVWSV